jgi:hypothetical protein
MTSDDWLRKIRDNAPFTERDIEILRPRLQQLDAGVSVPLIHQRFGDWEAEHCGKLRLPDPDDEIPIPFAPVLAGVLVAGEILKQELFAHAVLDSYYWNTLVGEFMRRNRARRPTPNPHCPICSKRAYRDQYRRRWGDPGR